MGLYTKRPGMTDETSRRYYEINQKLIELRNQLDALPLDAKKERKKLEDEIQKLLMEQVLLTM